MDKINCSVYVTSALYHFVIASLAVIPSSVAVVHPIARFSPWFSLELGGECLRSFSSARICAHCLASMDISVLF